MRILKTVEMREFDCVQDATRLVEVASVRRVAEQARVEASGRAFRGDKACRRATVRANMVVVEEEDRNAERGTPATVTVP